MTLLKRNLPTWGTLTDFFDDDWFKFRFNDWAPAVNIADNEDSYEIEVAAPGLKKEDFNVQVDGGILTISGKSEKEEEEKKKNYTRREFSSRSFSRSFTLPTNVDEDSIHAKYDDGVLRIALKKAGKANPPKKSVTIH